MSRWLACLAAVNVLLGVLLIVAAMLAGPRATGDPVSAGALTQPPELPSKAPPAEIQRLHEALHDLGTQCEGPAPERSKPAIDRDVNVILTFAVRYPEGRFAIDDETGSVVSLLLVARGSLRTCSPDAAAQANLALPPAFRDP